MAELYLRYDCWGAVNERFEGSQSVPQLQCYHENTASHGFVSNIIMEPHNDQKRPVSRHDRDEIMPKTSLATTQALAANVVSADDSAGTTRTATPLLSTPSKTAKPHKQPGRQGNSAKNNGTITASDHMHQKERIPELSQLGGSKEPGNEILAVTGASMDAAVLNGDNEISRSESHEMPAIGEPYAHSADSPVSHHVSTPLIDSDQVCWKVRKRHAIQAEVM